MKHLSLAPILVILLALTGCAANAKPDAPLTPPNNQYHAIIVDPTSGQMLTVEALASSLEQIDVVVVGEYHGHHAAHLLQARLQSALYRSKPEQVLTMEQFEVGRQSALDRYLQGNTGETEMIEDAAAWDNYRASYRPLVEYARTHHTPVRAANAPADVVRCVGRLGPDYLKSLTDAERSLLPEQPFMDPPAYREKFMAAIAGSHGTDDPSMAERLDNSYRAQLLRDNTMAERIIDAIDRYPRHQVLHLNGTFHSEERLGTVALLERRAPELTVAVITPVFWPPENAEAPLAGNRDKGDFLYFIQPLPLEFRDEERQRKALRARFGKSAGKAC